MVMHLKYAIGCWKKKKGGITLSPMSSGDSKRKKKSNGLKIGAQKI